MGSRVMLKPFSTTAPEVALVVESPTRTAAPLAVGELMMTQLALMWVEARAVAVPLGVMSAMLWTMTNYRNGVGVGKLTLVGAGSGGEGSGVGMGGGNTKRDRPNRPPPSSTGNGPCEPKGTETSITWANHVNRASGFHVNVRSSLIHHCDTSP